ncbi:AraC family transcriptional regulator [Lipingzhangella halophila]|uniref:AraC family transcriptional regulator n=1 Tax=Lipingzhangella halophila TaxID=1783352 RepID=A0A7W7RK21_9ACTN|nr:helix-turn-helix transcriptional regulator [Lipingzhangella halophila]MBB4932951.1 AraC family transcriptional regulator [Lipingzhangella halophila]
MTKPQQVGVSFAENSRVELTRCGRSTAVDIQPGDVFANGWQELYWSRVTRMDEALEIYPDPAVLRAAAGRSSAVEIEPLTAARDAVVLAIAARLKRAHVHDTCLDGVYASSLAHRLAEHLVTYYCGIRPDRGRPRGGLDRARLRRVTEVVDARVDEPLTISDLAAAAHLSPFHFARSFKESTGMAPHEFVTTRRMERAKALLMRGGLSAPEVAYRMGFSNLRHFRQMLYRCTGFMPGELRAGASE